MSKKNGIASVEGNTVHINDMSAFTNHLKNTAASLPTKVKIKKAKIKDDLFLEGEYSEDLPGHSKKDSKFSCTVPVHQDLKDAFAKLPKHLAVLCDELSVSGKIKDIDQWDDDKLINFSVRGFTIGGNDENEGCTISGMKEGKYGIVNLNSPFQKWEGSEYGHISSLAADIQSCVYEVEQYLFEGKRAPEQQLAMDFGGGDDGAENELINS